MQPPQKKKKSSKCSPWRYLISDSYKLDSTPEAYLPWRGTRPAALILPLIPSCGPQKHRQNLFYVTLCHFNLMCSVAQKLKYTKVLRKDDSVYDEGKCIAVNVVIVSRTDSCTKTNKAATATKCILTSATQSVHVDMFTCNIFSRSASMAELNKCSSKTQKRKRKIHLSWCKHSV